MEVFTAIVFTASHIITKKFNLLRIKIEQRANPQLQLIRDILHQSAQITVHYKSIIRGSFTSW